MPRRPLPDDERRLADEFRTAVARLRSYGHVDRDRPIDIVACVYRLPREVVGWLLAAHPTARPRSVA